MPRESSISLPTLSDSELGTILRDGVLPTFVLDDKGQIVFWNRGMTALTDLPADDALDSRIDILAADWPDLLLETAAAPAFETTIDLRLGGKTRPFYLTAFRKRVADRGSLCVVHLIDLSHRRQHEERQLHQQRMESLGRLAGGIAHDFNNILTIIRGNALVLRNDSNASDQMSHVADSIIKATQKGAAMISRLLTFSKPQPFTAFPLDISNLVEETLALVRHSEWDLVDVQMEMDPNLPPVKGEPNRLSQVLVNLFVNARDAMPDGGTLTVKVRRQQFVTPAEIPVDDAAPGLYVTIAVEDTGSGMSEDVKNRIFEPFFTTKSSGKGTGLGLPNVHTIIRQHGGWIEVDSELGRGSVFTLHLPVAEEIGRDGGSA